MALTDTTISISRWGRAPITRATLTAGKAVEILRQAKEKMDPNKVARLNKSLKVGQVWDILSHGIFKYKPDEPLNALVARNIIKEFGKFYKEPA